MNGKFVKVDMIVNVKSIEAKKQYDYWLKDYDFSILGLTETSSGSAEFKVIPNKEYYLVYYAYNSGDSCGNIKNRPIIVDLFETEEDAIKLVKILKLIEEYEKIGKGYNMNGKLTHKERASVKYRLKELGYKSKDEDIGAFTFKEKHYCVEYIGYFESLVDAYVKPVMLKI